mgnify:CR=1 FL=1
MSSVYRSKMRHVTRTALGIVFSLTALVTTQTTTADALTWGAARQSTSFLSYSLAVGRVGATASWNRSSRIARSELSSLKRCMGNPASCSSRGLRIWAETVNQLASIPAARRLAAVNSAINKVGRYRSDAAVYGVPDYWASPVEFFTNGGDCEDFALAKYWTLKALGARSEDMRVVVVKIRSSSEGHALLQVGRSNGAHLMDNRTNAVSRAAVDRRYAPIYAVSNAGSWLYVAAN